MVTGFHCIFCVLSWKKKNPTDLESEEVGLKNILLGISFFFFFNSNIKNTFLNIKKIIPKENRGTKKIVAESGLTGTHATSINVLMFVL